MPELQPVYLFIHTNWAEIWFFFVSFVRWFVAAGTASFIFFLSFSFFFRFLPYCIFMVQSFLCFVYDIILSRFIWYLYKSMLMLTLTLSLFTYIRRKKTPINSYLFYILSKQIQIKIFGYFNLQINNFSIIHILNVNKCDCIDAEFQQNHHFKWLTPHIISLISERWISWKSQWLKNFFLFFRNYLLHFVVYRLLRREQHNRHSVVALDVCVIQSFLYWNFYLPVSTTVALSWWPWIDTVSTYNRLEGQSFSSFGAMCLSLSLHHSFQIQWRRLDWNIHFVFILTESTVNGVLNERYSRFLVTYLIFALFFSMNLSTDT